MRAISVHSELIIIQRVLTSEDREIPYPHARRVIGE